jgi:hypothetical protein
MPPQADGEVRGAESREEKVQDQAEVVGEHTSSEEHGDNMGDERVEVSVLQGYFGFYGQY